MKESKKPKVSSLSKARSYEEMGEFWDKHEFTEFGDQVREVQMDMDIQVRRYYVAVEPNLMIELAKEAASKGISSQSLVNLLIQEHLGSQRK